MEDDGQRDCDDEGDEDGPRIAGQEPRERTVGRGPVHHVWLLSLVLEGRECINHARCPIT
jgi:hypothetical protein